MQRTAAHTLRLSLGIGLLASLVSAGADAMTLTVNSTADTVAADGVCTLREAVANVNAGSSVNAGCNPAGAWGTNDTIVFTPLPTPVTIVLASTLTLNAGVTMIGTGDPADLVLDGAAAGVQLVHVAASGSGPFSFYNITFTRGGQAGFNGGALWIEAGRTVTVYNCTFSLNNPPSPSAGGAIQNAGALTITATRFVGNSCAGGAGAISNAGTLTINGSVFTENSAAGPGGVGGGAIYANPGTQTTISDTTFSGNSSGNSGGGAVVISGGSGSILGSTFSGNTTSGSGAAVALMSGVGLTVGIQNSTFSGNAAVPNGWGGAIYMNGGTIDLRNVTVSGNQALIGGGVFVSGIGTVGQLRNSIVAGNTLAAGGSDPDFIVWPGNSMTSGDYNLFGTCTSCTLAAHDLTGVSPNLGSLANNGGPSSGLPTVGPTLTMLPNGGSPAINGGNPAGCLGLGGVNLTVDQRGFTRPYVGTICDVGAVEAQTVPVALMRFQVD